MIQRLETLYYQCLRHTEQDLAPFHVLGGPNGSGKTTFLDAIAFLGDLVRNGLDAAIHTRATDLRDLIWHGRTDRFEIAIELPVPEPETNLFVDHAYPRCRYEIAIGTTEDTRETGILAERVLLLTDNHREDRAIQESLFPVDGPTPQSLATPRVRGIKTIVNKVPGGNDKFYDETGAGWDPSFKLGPRRSALANLPEDEIRFPISTWLKHTLSEGIRLLTLNSEQMRRPSPPGQPHYLLPNGANLPWAVAALEEQAPVMFAAWLTLLRNVLPDLSTIHTVVRPEDRHCYLVVKHQNGLETPSWMLSGGTLRLLALTFLANVPDYDGIFLIEEPENGIHPGAVETIFRALSTVPRAQILATTHSPVVLGLAKPEQLLCFDASETGATQIVSGIDHPDLGNWQNGSDLNDMLSGGVLR
ncbi:MAG: AAA family ATPase [Candidatus Latescibacteria bacterium]|jgi:predicted ATPase|nr:AAA family ATPase [Candidatus Latescibacterota bacterium]